jgi:uncharacterized membrane protein
MGEFLSREDAGGNVIAAAPREFTPRRTGRACHLYRGELYRSTIWRTRLDNTTNAPMLSGEPSANREWPLVLGRDYREPRYHISYSANALILSSESPGKSIGGAAPMVELPGHGR